MPSPKSGTAGTLVKPTAPTDAKDSVDSTGGQTQSASNSGSKTGSSPSSVTVGAGPSSSQKSTDAPQHKPADSAEKTSWIELQLVYESNGLPVAGMYYEVTLPDGKTIASGSTDDKGLAHVGNIDPGSCQISFPELDQEAWEDA